MYKSVPLYIELLNPIMKGYVFYNEIYARLNLTFYTTLLCSDMKMCIESYTKAVELLTTFSRGPILRIRDIFYGI